MLDASFSPCVCELTQDYSSFYQLTSKRQCA
jgi:hypothetical protein